MTNINKYLYQWLFLISLIAPTGCATSPFELRPHRDYHGFYDRLLQADSAFNSQLWAQARERYEALSKSTYADQHIWLRLGQLYAIEGALAKSAQSMRTAINIDPSVKKARYGLAIIQLMQVRTVILELMSLSNGKEAAAQLKQQLRQVNMLLRSVNEGFW